MKKSLLHVLGIDIFLVNTLKDEHYWYYASNKRKKKKSVVVTSECSS